MGRCDREANSHRLTGPSLPIGMRALMTSFIQLCCHVVWVGVEVGVRGGGR